MGIQKKKETEDRENPPRQQTLSKPFLLPGTKLTRNFKKPPITA
jgi:hypothetical protein